MPKVILQGFILIPETELDLVRYELETHKRLTLEEPGCITFEVVENLDNPCRFDVYEEFVDESAFQQHQERVAVSRWGEVTVNVERHYTVSYEPLGPQ
ncbi:putative quinol monooxygenase [Salinicola endophyticus]|uniref:putative quinol monooxygenase n=1 Tax=Salinicola endophyticus TaxID=1949083 RepID=UPI000DA1CD43|nr:antibiotic biosynthesis monooxygenase [Salinicola endophyticus]